jgi:two-component system, cell cycle sensor histidine kinase and response regulator CckA
LATVDGQGRITQWNAAAESFSGLTAEEAIGRQAAEVLPYLDSFSARLERAIAAAEPQDLPGFALPAPGGGKARFIAASLFPLIHGNAKGAVLRLDDVTELERKETELRQAQKMDMVGNLTTGIAHDFNNLLMGIMGTASLLALKLEDGPAPAAEELRSDVKAILAISERARDLIKQISRISRRQELSLKEMDLKAALSSTMQICATSFDKSVDLRTSLPEGEAMIFADSVLIEQVILNLCVNAAHAMNIMRPEGERYGGRLDVSLEPVAADSHFCASHAMARPGAYWAVRVGDSGVGIDPDSMQKIFDPFYTTKSQGQGSGLGLSTVYSIVSQHQGFIDVYSTPGSGSVFSVYLRALGPKGSARTGEAAAEEIRRGSGRILVLDDEKSVRRVTQGMLEACGYSTVLAADLDEAKQALDGRAPGDAGARIDLAILDMSMPGISGVEAFRILKRSHPGLRALIASGYRHDPRIDAAIAEGALGFLQKPYSIQELSRKLAEALRAP